MTATRKETNQLKGLPIVEGSIAGIISWIVGYLAIYLMVAGDIRESPLNRMIEAFDGAPATYEMVGWVFYNAHFVNTVFTDIPLVGTQTTSAIGGEDGFTVLLYAIPIIFLLISGIGLTMYSDTKDLSESLLAGLTVVPGYLILSIAGLFLFEVSVGGATGAPDYLAGALLAGIVYPLLFGGIGGALGGIFEG